MFCCEWASVNCTQRLRRCFIGTETIIRVSQKTLTQIWIYLEYGWINRTNLLLQTITGHDKTKPCTVCYSLGEHHLNLWHQFTSDSPAHHHLTHWDRVTHICVSKLTIIGSDNGLSADRRQAIIWTNDGILLIRTFRTHFSEILSEIHTFSFKKMHFNMSSGKWRPPI